MNQRDICLVPFPFSDTSGMKVRPAVIVSNNGFNKTQQDVVLCAITSNCSGEDLLLLKTNSKTGLRHKSGIKVPALFKIQKDLLIKRIGTIDVQTHSQLKQQLLQLLK